MTTTVIYTNPTTGERLQRIGDCNQCGRCCGGNPIPKEMPDSPNGMCPLWQKTEIGGICTNLTHPYRLQACAHWPTKPAHIAPYIDTCGYRFVPVEE